MTLANALQNAETLEFGGDAMSRDQGNAKGLCQGANRHKRVADNAVLARSNLRLQLGNDLTSFSSVAFVKHDGKKGRAATWTK